MTTEIWKYQLERTPAPQRIQMPAGAQVVHVAMQHEHFTLWAHVDPERPPAPRSFIVVGTGTAIPPMHEHRGTVQIEEYVFHVLEFAPERTAIATHDGTTLRVDEHASR